MNSCCCVPLHFNFQKIHFFPILAICLLLFIVAVIIPAIACGVPAILDFDGEHIRCIPIILIEKSTIVTFFGESVVFILKRYLSDV